MPVIGLPILTLWMISLLAPAALAWGATGHEWVSSIAAEKLPDSLPSFIRSPEAIAEIGRLKREHPEIRKALVESVEKQARLRAVRESLLSEGDNLYLHGDEEMEQPSDNGNVNSE